MKLIYNFIDKWVHEYKFITDDIKLLEDTLNTSMYGAAFALLVATALDVDPVASTMGIFCMCFALMFAYAQKDYTDWRYNPWE